ncbi:hypothetical protein DBR11_27425 [Pedobacter sp. HMWF019]|nr:hypothetical protein DBR11_27425 [Pedobacter sp. HMWF019]
MPIPFPVPASGTAAILVSTPACVTGPIAACSISLSVGGSFSTGSLTTTGLEGKFTVLIFSFIGSAGISFFFSSGFT